MGRAPCCEKIGLKKGRWTAEEDDKLIKYIQQNGEGSWRSLPNNAGLLRCGKSCRLRWVNYLKLNVKRGNITPKEEELILKLHATLGNRWSIIARHLPGRTDNEIKNYWISHLSRKIHTVQRKGDEIIINVVDVGLPPKRRRGRVRRTEMQGNKSPNISTNNHCNYEENEKDIEESLMGLNGLLDTEKGESWVSPLGPEVDDGPELEAGWGEKNRIISWLFDDDDHDDQLLRENVSNLGDLGNEQAIIEWLLS